MITAKKISPLSIVASGLSSLQKERFRFRSANIPNYRTVLRIKTCVLYLVLPNGATVLKPHFRNIDAVPEVDSFPKARDNQRAMGYASTIPPPLFLIASIAAFNAALAMPRLRCFLFTAKQVIRQRFLPLSFSSRPRYLRLLSMRGSSSRKPYWHQPTGSPFANTKIPWAQPVSTSAFFSARFLTALSALVRNRFPLGRERGR